MSIGPVGSASTNTNPQVSPGGDADRSKQRAALAKLMRTYQNDIQHGQSASSLKSLAKQITDAAKALGQNVTLPTASANSSGSVTAWATASKVGMTA